MRAPWIFRFLDTTRFAIGVAFIGIAMLSLLSIKLWLDVREIVDDTNSATVANCYSRAAQTPSLRRVLEELERIAEDPQARLDIRGFIILTVQTTPTIKDCDLLAQKLDVERPREVNR